MILVLRERIVSSDMTRNYGSGKRLHILRVNCRCLLLEGMALMDLRKLIIYSGLGSVGLTYEKGQVRLVWGCAGHRKR